MRQHTESTKNKQQELQKQLHATTITITMPQWTCAWNAWLKVTGARAGIRDHWPYPGCSSPTGSPHGMCACVCVRYAWRIVKWNKNMSLYAPIQLNLRPCPYCTQPYMGRTRMPGRRAELGQQVLKWHKKYGHKQISHLSLNAKPTNLEISKTE